MNKMANKNDFYAWASGFSGCVGGDIGSSKSPTIWVCGIEWGEGYGRDGLLNQIQENVLLPPQGYSDSEENLRYRFNYLVIKLLTTIYGNSVSSYKDFAREKMPFVSGSSGYFKMNLFPIAFKCTQRSMLKEFSDITGFYSANDYLKWCRDNRLPKFRLAASTYKPKLIMCLGKTYIDDFEIAFAERNAIQNIQTIDDREIRWGFNKDGALVVVAPFLGGRYGLVRNTTIEKFGAKINSILSKS